MGARGECQSIKKKVHHREVFWVFSLFVSSCTKENYLVFFCQQDAPERSLPTPHVLQRWQLISEDLNNFLYSESSCFITLPLLFSSRNSSTKDLTLFAAEAIAFNRQLSQHDEQQEEEGVAVIVCSMRLSPPSNSRLARRRAESNALRSQDFTSSFDDPAAWRSSTSPQSYLLSFRLSLNWFPMI